MAFPSALSSTLWTLSLLAALFAAVHSNIVYDEDPLQPTTQDETVSVGGTVTLTCQVPSSDNSSLQWSNTAQQTLYFGEKRALRDNRIQLKRSTATELSITIGDVQLSDEGEYTCSIFTMPVRTARATVTVLGVPGAPQISGFEQPIEEGGKVTLSCTSGGSKPPATLHWYRGDEELEGRPDVVESVPDDPTYNVSSELDLVVSRSDDDAVITCAVGHPSLTAGDKRSQTTLRVLYSPDVQIEAETNLPREGEKFHLKCLGKGNPLPSSYIWEKKDGELPPLAKVDGAFLRFEMLNKSDNGVYICHADNGIGNTHGEYTLLVQGLFDNLDVDPFFGSGGGFDPAFSTDSPPETAPTASPTSSLTPPPTPDTISDLDPTTALSNALFPDLPLSPDLSPTRSSSSDSDAVPPPSSSPSSSPSPSALTPSVAVRLNGVYTFTDAAVNKADTTAMSTSSGVDHAVIGGVVAVIVFILLCLLIVLGRYLIRHKGTYLTHEAKGSDDAPDADTAIINAEGGHSGGDDKKEYFI